MSTSSESNLRFNVRFLLTVTAVIAVIAALINFLIQQQRSIEKKEASKRARQSICADAVFAADGHLGFDGYGHGNVIAIYFGWRNVEDFSMLRDCTKLVYFDARGSNFFDLSLLHGEHLRELALGETPVRDLEPLRAGFPELRYLNLRNTKITDVSPLATLENLRALDVSLTSVTDLSPLKQCHNLRSLTLSPTTSQEVIRELSAVLPRCRITTWGPGRTKWVSSAGHGVEYHGFLPKQAVRK